MGRGRATALALTDYALAELAAPYLDLGPTELASQPRPVQEKVALQPKPARKKAAVRTAEDDAAMLTQIWGLYLGSRFRWRGVRWVTRTTEEWRIALKLPPQFAVTKKVSEMEEAGWLFVDRWARGYVTVRPTPELMTLMKTHQGVFPVEMLKQGE